MTALSTIKIPERVYVGFQGRRTEDEVPLGFMTPYDETAAGKKRQDTVDAWAKPYHHDTTTKAFNSVIIDNKPMIGFKIGRAIRRHSSFGGTSTVVRIEDPRGFELEIGVENLVLLMSNNIMEDCELMQECLWGRDGGKNILLPINSEPYKDYLNTQTLINNKVSLKDVKIGDTIKVLGGETGIYLGSLFPLYRKKVYDYNSHPTSHTVDVEFGDKKRYLMRYVNDDGSIRYDGSSALKVERIVEKAQSPLKPESVYQIINNDVRSGKCSHYSVGVSGEIYSWVYDTKMTMDKTIERVPVSIPDLQNAYANWNNDRDLRERSFIVMVRDGVELLSCNDYNFGSSGKNYQSQHPQKRQYISYKQNSNSHYGYYGQSYTYTDGFVGSMMFNAQSLPLEQSDSKTHFDDENAEFFKINIVVKLGNGFEVSVPA